MSSPLAASEAATGSVRLNPTWRLWEQFGLRGTGFPASGVLELAPPALVAAARQFDGEGALTGPAWQEFDQLFATSAVENARTLQRICAQPAFQAAVAWQNRAVLGRVIGLFLASEPTVAGRTSKPREREELIAHYWQRFCVKNDTIGFFGPVGWGGWDPSGRGLSVEPGTGLIARSEVYFASWAIDAVARTIEADPRSRDWIAPRRVPFVRLVGDRMRVPGRPLQEISSGLAEVYQLCDGLRTAMQIQQQLGGGIDVRAALAELVGRRWVAWKLEVPAGPHPERYLRHWLTEVGDPGLAEFGLQLLSVLEAGRARVSAATGPELPDALEALEDDFATATEVTALRTKGGKTAPGRSVVYSDCIRSARATLGTDVLPALEPLELLLTGASWLTSQLAAGVLARARTVYDELTANGDPLDLATFWFACMPILHGDAVSLAAELRREQIRRWGQILNVPAGSRRIQRSCGAIEAGVRAAFGEPVAGWTAARYLSPDIMIGTTDPAGVARGDFELVLGELHVASNTLGASLFVHQHQSPGELLAMTSWDHPGARLLPMLAKEHRSRLSIRIRNSLVRPEDYYVALVDYTGDPHRERTVLSADVQVRLRDDQLVAVLPDGAVFDAIDAFGHVLTTLVMDMFQVLPEADHSPRVTVDRLVVARESWCFGVADIGFVAEKVESRRFVLARRWREAMGLPRFVFVVSPTEPRPFYVDFDAPVYVNIFAKAVRRLARQDPVGRLVVTEMLPTPDQAWLVDDQGNRYTSELRFVAVNETARGDAG